MQSSKVVWVRNDGWSRIVYSETEGDDRSPWFTVETYHTDSLGNDSWRESNRDDSDLTMKTFALELFEHPLPDDHGMSGRLV